MKRALLGGLSTLLLPFSAHAAATSAGGYLMRGGYQPRSYLRMDHRTGSSVADLARNGAPSVKQRTQHPRDVTADSLAVLQTAAVTELVVIDSSVQDKATLYRGLRPGVAAVEIDASRPGLPQLVEALRGYRALAAIHVVSHANAGVLQLGSSRIDAEAMHGELSAMQALRGAVRDGADLLLYGCDLAAGASGEALLDIIHQGTGMDVAGSSNLTGDAEQGGDWELEVQRGSFDTALAFSAKALADFSDVLVASNGTKTFAMFTDAGNTLVNTDFTASARDGTNAVLNVSLYAGGIAYIQTGGTQTGNYFYVQADGANTTAFELTGLNAGEYLDGQFTNMRVVGMLASGGTVTSSTVNGSATQGESFSFSGGELSAFAGQKLKGFKLYVDCQGTCASPPNNLAFFEFRNFTIQGAIDTPPAPIVTDARISISGATGTGGAFKIGDTVTAIWNNTAAGDNSGVMTGVTVDFSQFGGGAAVAASNSSNTWTATYTITSGAIDAINSNISVTATNTGGSTTIGDTTNATVDNIAPTVTDGNIAISGASGTGGAYRIGDTVTATWNNAPAGDNNSDTISGATVNFSQFGGGAAVSATNSGGTWTATYTLPSGALQTTGRNVSFTATDNAGNLTTVVDTTNAAVDTAPPAVTAITVSGSPAATATSVTFTVAFNEAVSNVSTDDFTLVTTGSATGTISAVSASSGTSIDVTVSGIAGDGTLEVNLNGSTNIVDAAGNSGPAAFTSGSTHTVAIPTAPGAPTIGTATAGDGQVSVTFTAPGSNGGSAITTYTATASPGGAFGTCAGPAACTATVTGLSNGTAYTFTVTATNAIGTGVASGASNAATPKGSQTLTFGNPGAQNFGTTPTLTATATSGLAPTFSSSTTGVCTITSGGALTFVTAGSCTIDADQAGDAVWNAATTVSQTFTVNAVVPGAPTIGTATAGDTEATITFTGPASIGGAAIIAGGYTVTANPGGATGTGSNSPITVAGLTNGVAYTFTVTATNSAGTGSASAASNSITPASPQTIIFANPGTRTFGTSPTIGATSSSGLTVSFTSATTAVCTITPGGTLTFIAAGTCTIHADQAGDSSFLPASQVSQSFSVAPVVPGAPTIGTAIAGDTQASVAFTAPLNIGGSAITSYTVTVNPADVAPINGASSPIVVTGLTNGIAYTFTVTADNVAGTGPASAASNSITPAATQTITFNNPGAQNFGTTPTLTATSDSGLTPTFTSSTTGVCTITSGGALTFVTAGTCTINADQAGNGSYLAAPQVSRTFTVNPVVPGAPTIGVATVASPTEVDVAFSAPASDGGIAITGYTVTASPGGATTTGAASPIRFPGLTAGVSYTFTVTATNSAGTGVASAASNAVVTAVTQVITFANPGAQNFGTTPTLSATADSGLAVSFASATTAVCTITPTGTLAFIAVGTCTINADQAGDASHLPASQVSQTFSVNALVPDAPVIGTATMASATSATVSFTAPAFTGGAPVTGYVVTASPGGASTNGAGSPITIAGLTSGTAYTFAVMAQNGAGNSVSSAPSNAVTPIPALTVAAASATLPYGAGATPVTLSITGAATSVAVGTAPVNGIATVSGTTISYQPNAGYAGPDSFTYTASDAYQTTAAATVAITVTAPTVVLDAANPGNGAGGTAYTHAFLASGGASPYRFQLVGGALPSGLSLGTDGRLTGTPTVAGSFTLTVEVTDSSTGTGPFTAQQQYTLQVVAPQIAFALPALPQATHASAFDQTLAVTGGTAPYTYAVTAGSLPQGVALSAAGVLSGTPTASGRFSFTVEARDANGFTGAQAYELVVAQALQAITGFSANPATPVFAPNGTFTVAATGGASGNPVVFASATAQVCQVSGATVTMLAAGRCSLTADQAGDANHEAAPQVRLDVDIAAAVPTLEWPEELRKVFGEPAFDLVNPQSPSSGAFTFSSSDPEVASINGHTVTLHAEGETVITASQAAAGNYAAASVEMRLQVEVRPDPTRDPGVVGLLQAQVDASVRFASAQQSNIRDRLRQVRSGANGSSNNVTLAYAGSEERQGLSVPVGQATGGSLPALPQGWGAWASGTATFGKSGRAGGYDFQTDGLTLGADRAIGEQVLVGVAGSLARNDSDLDGTASRLKADQRSLALYGLWRAGEHVFVDGMLATGRLDFDIRRWSDDAGAMGTAVRDGKQWFGSLAFGYEHRGERMALTTYGRFDASRTTLEAYREYGMDIYDLAYRRQVVENSTVALGLEGSYRFGGDDGRYRPFWSLEYRQALEDKGEAAMNYVVWPHPTDYRLDMQSYNDDALALSAGLDVKLRQGWLLSLLFGHEQASNSTQGSSIGLRLSYGQPSSGGFVPDDGTMAGDAARRCGRRCANSGAAPR